MFLTANLYFWVYVAVWVSAIVWVDVAYRRGRGAFDAWCARENLPHTVLHSVVVGAEVELSGKLGRGQEVIHGRADQIMKAAAGAHYLIDTKLRNAHRVYEEDIVQISLYRELMVQNQYEPVSEFAFIRTVVKRGTGKGVRYHKVRALSAAELSVLLGEEGQSAAQPGRDELQLHRHKDVENDAATQNRDLSCLDFAAVR